MRVVVDLQCCQNGSRHRGIGRYAMALTKALIAQRGGHEILVFLTDRYPEAAHAVRHELDSFLPQSSIFVCSTFVNTEANKPDNAWRTRAAEIVRTEFLVALGPDIVFVPSLFEGFCDDVVTSVDPAPFRTVVTLHDFIPLEEPERHLSGQHDWDAYARKARDVRRADLLVAISSYTAESATRLLQVDPGRVIVIHNGVEEWFRPTESRDLVQSLDRFGIRQPFVFNTSPLEHRKNLEGLITGFARMSRGTINDHQLVIAGNLAPLSQAYLSDLSNAAGIPEGKLILPGYLSDRDLVDLYGRCELFVFPSFSEGFGLPPLEAMACGAPVIASGRTSIPEVIGRTDLLFDPTDVDALGIAMERVLTNPILRRELRAFSLQRARLFSWSNAAGRLLDAFKASLTHTAAHHSPTPSSRTKTRLAVVLPAASESSAIAGKCASLMPALERIAEITIVRNASAPPEPWLDATFDHHNLDWLDRNAARFDAIVYVTGALVGEPVAERMAVHPGIILRLREPAVASSLAASGFRLPQTLRQPLDSTCPVGNLHGFVSGAVDRGSASSHTQVLPQTLGFDVLEEGDLPLLPVARSHRGAIEIRRRFDVPASTPLIIAFVGNREGEEQLRAQLDGALAGSAALVFHRMAERGDADDQPSELRDNEQTRTMTDDLLSCYRSLISAADLILSVGMAECVVAQIEVDSQTLHIPMIADIDPEEDLAERVLANYLAPDRMQAIVGTVSDTTLAPWAEGLGDALTRWRARAPSMLHRVATRLPAAVREIWPDATDMRRLATSVSTNAALERAPLVWLDLTAYTEHDASVEGDHPSRAWLRSLLDRGGGIIHPVRADGDRFVCCNRSVFKALGLEIPFCYGDSSVAVRPGDRFVGLEACHSYGTKTFAALADAYARGASLLYVSTGLGRAKGALDQILIDVVLSSTIWPPREDGQLAGWSDKHVDPAVDVFLAWTSRAGLPVRVFHPERYAKPVGAAS